MRAAAEIARALPELSNEFAQSLDEVGLCQTLQLEAAMHWEHARSAAAEDAWQRAAQYARRANDRRQLTDILGWLASAMVLAASGRVSEVHAVAVQALDLYQRKGNLPGTRESLGCLTRYAHI